MGTCTSQTGGTHVIPRSAPEPGPSLCTNRAQIMPDRLFRDRRDAGRFLAGRLEEYRGRPDVIVLGLPRGGVPVAYEVATALGAPLDVFLVRKLGTPGREELAMGAIASGGVMVINDDVVRGLVIAPEAIQHAAEREGREDRKSTRLNSSHVEISYAVFCLKKKKEK